MSDEDGIDLKQLKMTDLEPILREQRAKEPPCKHCGKKLPENPHLFHVCTGAIVEFQKSVRDTKAIMDRIDWNPMREFAVAAASEREYLASCALCGVPIDGPHPCRDSRPDDPAVLRIVIHQGPGTRINPNGYRIWSKACTGHPCSCTGVTPPGRL